MVVQEDTMRKKDDEFIIDVGDVELVTQPKKKKGKLLIIALIAVLAIGAIGFLVISKKSGKSEESVVEIDYQNSGLFAYGKLLNALLSYDAYALDAAVGIEDGDSYLAQEWAYINGVQLRQEFVQKIGKTLKFEYPKLEDGRDCPMNNGEYVTITYPDYEKMLATMDEDKMYIESLYKTSGYSETDYDFTDKLFNLMCQYIVDKVELPTTTAELRMPIIVGVDGMPVIGTDEALDDLLFGSEGIRNLSRKFSQLCLGWTGHKDEYYTEKEEQHNEEYDAWYAVFSAYFEADNGRFVKGRSKWEPWYLRDEANKFVLDENGEKIVNYYTVKDESGNDWVQPDETILVNVEKVRQVEDPWTEERGIPYTMVGTSYIQNTYAGKSDTSFRVGDGTLERPAGLGTSIITKVLCDNGSYADVRVTLKGYLTKQDAINYIESFSTKNKGFTVNSVVQLICYEVQVENLSKETITFSSEMTLCDANANISSRTGTVYGFIDSLTLKSGESGILNDWASSTELNQKYASWGKSFGRQFKMVYFDILAGTGDVPTYSAYEQFTGKSILD